MTFGSADGQRLAFSVEIRKEVDESFSNIGGFFRQFELSVIAADEKGIIFTRSNMRHESVYLYPLTHDKQKMRALLMTYLQKGHELNQQPKWCQTITSNCTTVIYQLVRMIDADDKILPFDYRVLVSGRLPSYLIELGVIRPKYDPDQWKKSPTLTQKLPCMTMVMPSQSSNSPKRYEKICQDDGFAFLRKEKISFAPYIFYVNFSKIRFYQ